jgi:hypothetical protein
MEEGKLRRKEIPKCRWSDIGEEEQKRGRLTRKGTSLGQF